MLHSYSMEGFELRLEGPVLEMRTEGERTTGLVHDTSPAFGSFFDRHDIRGVIVDLRSAEYQFNARQWEEGAHAFARRCRALPLAVIDRQDQARRTQRLLELHTGMGGQSESFRSRKKARNWIRQSIDAAPVS